MPWTGKSSSLMSACLLFMMNQGSLEHVLLHAQADSAKYKGVDEIELRRGNNLEILFIGATEPCAKSPFKHNWEHVKWSALSKSQNLVRKHFITKCPLLKSSNAYYPDSFLGHAIWHPISVSRHCFLPGHVLLDAKIPCEYIGSFLQRIEALPFVQKGYNPTTCSKVSPAYSPIDLTKGTPPHHHLHPSLSCVLRWKTRGCEHIVVGCHIIELPTSNIRTLDMRLPSMRRERHSVPQKFRSMPSGLHSSESGQVRLRILRNALFLLFLVKAAFRVQLRYLCGSPQSVYVCVALARMFSATSTSAKDVTWLAHSWTKNSHTRRKKRAHYTYISFQVHESSETSRFFVHFIVVSVARRLDRDASSMFRRRRFQMKQSLSSFRTSWLLSCSSSLQTCEAYAWPRTSGFQIASTNRKGSLQRRNAKMSSTTMRQTMWMLSVKDSSVMCGRNHRVCATRRRRMHSFLLRNNERW